MQKVGNHAVVLGASVGGLLAARALRDHFRRVTVIERDALPELGASRKGVPQDRHAHALLARGSALLEGFFPGFIADMALLGARRGDVLGDGNWVLDGQRLPRTESGMLGLLCGRALLEGYLRERLLEEGGVTLRTRCEASGLVALAARACCCRAS
jgi:2-polyprenyl-6-methoxyphenol hydroxylase-like FAD-dependent oxidoreductase